MELVVTVAMEALVAMVDPAARLAPPADLEETEVIVVFWVLVASVRVSTELAEREEKEVKAERPWMQASL